MNIIEKSGSFRLLKCAPNLCQECAIAHRPDEAHNAQSLYYQMTFRLTHGRFPTWRDAVAHCKEPVRILWQTELERLGAWPNDDDTPRNGAPTRNDP